MDRLFTVTNVITKEDNPEISLSVLDLKGINRHVINLETTAVYHCTKGIVTFAIGDDENLSFVSLTKGKGIIIKPNTPYLDFSEDGATLLAIDKNAFNIDQVKELPISDSLIDQIKKNIGAQRFKRLLTSKQS
jgi:hypothetical protein